MNGDLRLASACIVLALYGCGGSTSQTRDDGGTSSGGASAGSGPWRGGASLGGADSAIAGSGASPANLPPTPHSWNATIHGGIDATFTLAYYENGNTLSAFLGADGHMTTATFNRSSSDGSLNLVAPCDFAPFPSPLAKVQLKTLAIQGLDTDGDGIVDRLQGSGTETGVTVSDEPMSISGDFTFDAVPDLVAPSVKAEQDHNPIDPISLNASEPLDQTSLSLAGTPTLRLPSPSAGGALISLTNDAVLPFSQTWQLSGGGLDFSGNALEASGALTTLMDPGVFPQDGFEGPVVAALSGASVIDATSGVTPPTGQHALLIRTGSATFHLKSSGDAPETLSFIFQELAYKNHGTPGAGAGSIRVEAAVIGGTTRASAPFQPVGQVTLDNPTWGVASTPVTATLPLTEKGTDIVVRFSVNMCTHCDLFTSQPPSALVIDDLKLL